MEVEKLDAKQLKKKFSRRDFLKGAGISAVVGLATVGASKYGLSKLTDFSLEAEKEVRRLVRDLQAFSGKFDRELAEQNDYLVKHINSDGFNILKELKIVEPAEVKKLEEIVKNCEEFEAHYSFAERAHEFKDRIDQRLLGLDAALENLQPNAVQKLNDAIREVFGQKNGEEGKHYRADFKKKLDTLVNIYNTNEDNKVAQTEVLKHINQYLENSELTAEEKEAFTFMKEQMQKEGKEGYVKDFVKNYDKFEGRNESLIKLRAYITKAEDLYAKIRENTVYAQRLQGLLKDGIALKEEVRSTAVEDIEKNRQQLAKKTDELANSVNSVVTELEDKGYDIETREDYINKGVLSGHADKIRSYLAPLPWIAGTITAGLTWLLYRKNRKVRVANSALDEAVNRYNSDIASRAQAASTVSGICDKLREEKTELENKNTELRKEIAADEERIKYGPGNDVY